MQRDVGVTGRMITGWRLRGRREVTAQEIDVRSKDFSYQTPQKHDNRTLTFQIHHGRFNDQHCMPVLCALAMHLNYDLSALFSIL